MRLKTSHLILHLEGSARAQQLDAEGASEHLLLPLLAFPPLVDRGVGRVGKQPRRVRLRQVSA